MKKKALIFYISRYSGHFQGAKAIESGLYEVCDGVEVKTINAIEYTNPILGKILNKAYLEVIKKKPEFWGQIYDNPDVLERLRKTREAVHKYNMPKIRKLLDRYSPDAVFCTQAFPCGMVAECKKNGGSTIPLIGVLTDYAPHSYWLYDEVDYYVVPSEDTARIFEQKGVPEEKIKVYGIPVDPKFRLNNDKRRIRTELGFSENSPTILVMGGSQGLGQIGEAVERLLLDKEHGYQLLVITGTNKRLYKKLKKIGLRKEGCMRVFPYVGNIDELMEVSDAIITKAGGLTTAEALVKKLPVFIIDPIPGQERMNTDHLVRGGVAIEVGDLSELHVNINKLFSSKETLSQMSESAGKLSRPESSIDIAKLAVERS